VALLVPPELTQLLAGLRRQGLVLFPIRHHSPACALHLRALIERRRPEAVLVEGPRDFDALIPALIDARTQPPVAIYAAYVDRRRYLPRARGATRGQGEPPRLAAWYPFCAHSPELVALQAGAASSAELHFIDLTHAEHAFAARAMIDADRAHRARSLLEEGHLKHSAGLARLARNSGCRDHDDLWDHLFELHARDRDTDDFIDGVAAYCWFARQDYSREALAADGTLARERGMAHAIREHVRRFPGDADRGGVVVVTGGFHAVAFPELLAQDLSQPRDLDIGRDDALAVLTAFGFAQLDVLSGYGAGLPSPAYYDRLWRALNDPANPEPLLDTASALLVELGRLARERDLPAGISTADMVAALEQARRLAELRGHVGPSREDLLDAVRSCFTKGALDGEGAWVMSLAREAFSGHAVGKPAPGARQPPLVLDFRDRAARCHLHLDDSVPHHLALELYRRPLHREASRLLHALILLEVPFAVLVGGPDFVAGHDVDALVEHWDQTWSPATEAALVERSVLGATLVEAAATRLEELLGRLEEDGRSRSLPEAVRLLVEACRVGLHNQTAGLMTLIGEQLREDPTFASVASGLAQLVLLWRAREPLEAWRIDDLDELVRAAWQRACYLVDELAACPPEEVGKAIDGLSRLRELLAIPHGGLLDADLLWPRLEALSLRPGCAAGVVGACAGLLHGAGRLPDVSLDHLIGVWLRTGVGVDAAAAFLQGLLRAARECAWQSDTLLAALDRLLQEWSDDDFRRALPQLRLAWTDLTPRETERVAGLIARHHGGSDIGDLVHTTVTEGALDLGLRLTAEVKATLDSDGLGGWAGSGEGA
jgi:hypothetical protein